MRDREAEEVEGRRHRRVGEFLEALIEGQGVGGLEGLVVTGFRVRLPTEEEPSCLLVVRAAAAGGDQIAFVGAYGICDAILAWRARSAACHMKWRDDVPWAER